MYKIQGLFLCPQGRYGCCRFLRDGYKTPKEVCFFSPQGNRVELFLLFVALFRDNSYVIDGIFADH
jgi:hypothetical protein